jgi:tetratricopeptide (TPR) repeat protein
MTPTAVSAPEETAVLNGIPTKDIRTQLDQILRSRSFIQSHRVRRFLEFVVQESLFGRPHRLKEYLIGLEVFDRHDAFDPRVDSIVRVEARRLRHKLEEYYRTEGREDPIRIVLRKGSYVPVYEYQSATSGMPGVSQRRVIEVAPFSLLGDVSAMIDSPGDPTPIADEIQRRLTHVLIREGCFQVIHNSQTNVGHTDASQTITGQTNGNPMNGETNGHSHAGNGNGHSSVDTRSDYVVEGSLEFHPDHFHLILQLQQCAGGSLVWSGAIDGQSQDLGAVERLAQCLVRDLLAPTTDAVAGRRQAASKECRDSYLQGRYYWKLATPGSIRESIAYFSKAVESDSSYAAAWAALAEALLVSSMFGLDAPAEAGVRMKEAAGKAATLSPSLPEAHVALGSVLSILDWDWAAGEQELKEAIQLDGHDPVGHLAYGIHLACRGMLDAALAEVERALELDPAALFPNFVLGWLYGVSRRFDEAIAQHLLVSRLAPDYALPHLGLGLAYAGKGLFADAIAHLTNASQMKCRSLLDGQMGYCYARAGRRDEALREIEGLKNRAASSYVSPVSLATIYAGLGETPTALASLEHAVEVHDISLPVHLLSAAFDTLRDEPRFQALRRNIGLE